MPAIVFEQEFSDFKPRRVHFDFANGVVLFSGGSPRITKRWTCPDYEPLPDLEMHGIYDIGSNGLYLGFDDGVQARDSQTGSVLWEAGHAEACLVDPTSGIVVAQRDDRSISLINPKNGELVVPRLIPHPSSIVALSTSTDGKLCVVGHGGEVRLWYLENGKPAGRLSSFVDDVVSGCISSDGTEVAVVNSKRMEVWNTKRKELSATRIPVHQAFAGVQSGNFRNRFAVSEVRVEPNPKFTPSGSQKRWIETGSTFLFQGDALEPTAELDHPAVWFSPVGTLAVGYRERHPRDNDIGDYSIKVWKVEAFGADEPTRLECDAPVYSAAASSDGRYVAIVEVGRLKVWDLQTQCV